MARGDLYIEPHAQISTVWKRPARTQDSRGDPTGSPTTLATVTMDWQPIEGGVARLQYASDPRSTHVGFPLTELLVHLKPGDLGFFTQDDTAYTARVTFVHHYTGAHSEIEAEIVEGDE